MQKQYMPFLLLMLLHVVSFGQVNVQVNMGEEYSAHKKITLDGIIGYDDSGIYVLSRKGYSYNHLYIEHFDNELKKTRSQEVTLKTEGKERSFEFVIHSNNTLFLFSSFINSKLKKKILFVETINKQTLVPNNDLRKIADVDFGVRYNSGSFLYKISEDRNRILVFYNLPYEKNEAEKFGFHVFDADMKPLWNKSISLPYTDQLFSIYTHLVDNHGKVYVLGRVYEEKAKEERKGKVNYRYAILAYSGEGDTPKEYSVSLADKFLTDMQIAVNDKGDIICAGFYSEKGTSSIRGTYYIRVDGETKDIIKTSMKEFTLDFITMEMTEKAAEKVKKKAEKGKDVELYKFDLDDIILRNDGGAVLIGEQYYVEVVTYMVSNGNGGMTTQTSYRYHYNDILVININAQGEIDWATKIPKSQLSSNDGGFFSSYAKAVGSEKLYFIFNDNPRNLNTESDKKYTFIPSNKESVVVCIQIDRNGTLEKKALFSMREAAIITRPKVCEQIDDRTLIIYGQKKTAHRFAAMGFE